jgi:branched-chain amino acid transport system substrate-binding protein
MITAQFAPQKTRMETTMRHLRHVPALAAILFASSAVYAQETIKIGMVQPLTGSVAYNGNADVNGSKLAVE